MCYVSKLLLRFHYANLLFLLLYSPFFDEKSKQRCVKSILLPFGYNIFVLLQAKTLVLRYDGISLSLLLNKNKWTEASRPSPLALRKSIYY